MAYPVAILAGGLATRLYPLTETIPKALLPVAGHPFIWHQLRLLRAQGIEQVVICAGFLGEAIQEFVEDGAAFDLKVEYSFDGKELLGTAGAIKRALPLLGQAFWVMYGDSYLEIDLEKVEQYFLSSSFQAVMAVLKNENLWDHSNLVLKNGKIIHYDKAHPSANYIDFGITLMRDQAFASFSPDQKIDLAEVFKLLIARGQLAGYEVKNRFYEIGSLKGLQETTEYLERRCTA